MKRTDTTLHIIAPGPGAANYKPKKDDNTMGVHAIWQTHKVDEIYIQDYPTTFEPWKLEMILNSYPKFGFVMAQEFHRDEFSELPSTIFDHAVWAQVKLNDKRLCPVGPSAGFSAAAFAAWVGYKHLIIWGCDYTGHQVHSQNLDFIAQHWRELAEAIRAKGGTIETGYDCNLTQWIK